MKIAITTNATDNYLYAMGSFLQAVAQNLYVLHERRKKKDKILLILVGNESMKQWEDLTEQLGFKDDEWKSSVDLIIEPKWQETEKYSESQNLMVSQMRMSAMNRARRWGADALWMLDADVIPQPNSLAVSLQMLEFDGGWYDLAFCPYPSQGGGSFLGGHGTPRSPIFPDFLPEEREVPKRLMARFEKAEEAFRKKESQKTWDALVDVRREIERKCPPKFGGNIMKHNAEFGWRRRGWYDYAYPDIGLGAVVPTNWWGFGCLLISKKALGFSDFVGYTGKGTEDLFVGYQKYWVRNFRSCMIPHCPAGHIIRREIEGTVKKEIIHCHVSHEIMDEETHGHLRRSYMPHYQHLPGEEFKSEKDYQVIHIDEEKVNQENGDRRQGVEPKEDSQEEEESTD